MAGQPGCKSIRMRTVRKAIVNLVLNSYADEWWWSTRLLCYWFMTPKLTILASEKHNFESYPLVLPWIFPSVIHIDEHSTEVSQNSLCWRHVWQIAMYNLFAKPEHDPHYNVVRDFQVGIPQFFNKTHLVGVSRLVIRYIRGVIDQS